MALFLVQHGKSLPKDKDSEQNSLFPRFWGVASTSTDQKMKVTLDKMTTQTNFGIDRLFGITFTGIKKYLSTYA